MGEQPEGVAAYITVRSGALCDSDKTENNYNSVWSMIFSANSNGGWIQSGFDRVYAKSIVHFAQAVECNPGCAFFNHFGPEAPASTGEVHIYWVQYATDFPGSYANVDFTQFIKVTFNIKTSPHWTVRPWKLAWEGEATYRESDMPGSPTGATHFEQMQMQVLNNEAKWTYNLPSTSGDNGNANRWGRSPAVDYASCTGPCFDIWTK